MKKIIHIVLAVLLGLSLIASGYLKLLPIEYFENDLLQHHLGTEITVLFLSRLLIGAEFVLGALLIGQFYQKQVLRLTLAMLTVYTIYLAILLATQGNIEDCGCFGPHLHMTPLQGILKNIVLIGVTLLLLRKPIAETEKKWRMIVSAAIIVLGTGLPFVLYKIDFPQYTVVDGQSLEQVPLDILYSTEAAPPPWELRKGKVIVAFMTLTCPRCRMAANKLEVLKRNHPELPIYFIINGKKEMEADFLEATKTRDVPFTYFNRGAELVKVCGTEFPAILMIENSLLIDNLSYTELNEENLVRWYSGDPVR